ncbi:hypothetical protein [Marinigracilibium pacificum]|uniref:Uncharacterized protein n=1 Tax=Marinigracilibium pacificum TaxID=2729599 RepID=A0A848J5V6_9BACT|nr:hypothetical protein [Marinigracilibium pacificum]NMM48512.1 hypothetical protein [Marinigracilibium pacificum]
MHKSILSAILFFFYFISISQVVNDNISDRLILDIEQIANSRTDNCTLELNCIDQSVTGSCLIYHNDQWFQFNSGDNSLLYLNVFDQDCKDLRGIQVVVLGGEPCDKQSYDVLACSSFGNQNDVYLTLDNLMPNTNYIVLVDGYLEDFCRFKIQLSSKPNGIPVEQHLDLNIKVKKSEKEVNLAWYLPDSLKSTVVRFEIYKRMKGEFKSRLDTVINVQNYAYGNAEGSYEYVDLIRPGERNNYQVIARYFDNTAKIILDMVAEPRNNVVINNPEFLKIVPQIRIRKKDRVTVVIRDYYSRNIIKSANYLGKEIPESGLLLNPNEYSVKGIEKLRVEIMNNDTGAKEELYFDVSSKISY